MGVVGLPGACRLQCNVTVGQVEAEVVEEEEIVGVGLPAAYRLQCTVAVGLMEVG